MMKSGQRAVSPLEIRAIFLFQAALLCFLFAIGCETSSPTPSPLSKPITIWHALRGADQVNLQADLRDYERETGESVVALQLPHNAFANKLQVAIPRGNGPDLFIGAHDRVGDWAEAGLIEPVSFWVDQEQYRHYVSSSLEAFTYQRQLFGLPVSCKALALFYNPQLVAPPETVSALIQNMEKLSLTRSKDRSLWGLAYPEVDSLYFHAPWLHAFGGVAIRNGSPMLDSEAMKKSARLIKTLREKKFIPPEIDGALTSTLFRNGQLAYLINGPWFIAELEGLPSSQWAVAALPTLDETKRPLKPYLSVEGVMISAYTKTRKRAWKLAQYLASKPIASRRLKRGELIARLDIDQSSLSSWQRTFQAQIADSVPLSNDPMMKALWTPSKRALGQAIVYDAPVNQAFAEAQAAAQRAISGGVTHDE